MFRRPPPGAAESNSRQTAASRTLHFGTVLAISAITLLHAPRASAADTEPMYYMYRGQPKQLTLDAEHIAVLAHTTSGEFPAGLTNRGFSATDIEAKPLNGWMILRARSLAGG